MSLECGKLHLAGTVLLRLDPNTGELAAAFAVLPSLNIEVHSSVGGEVVRQAFVSYVEDFLATLVCPHWSHLCTFSSMLSIQAELALSLIPI